MPRPSRSRAATEYHYQRAYKACVPCRQRKVKCDLGPGHYNRICKRCDKLKLECHFTAQKPWSRKGKGMRPTQVGTVNTYLRLTGLGSTKENSELHVATRVQDMDQGGLSGSQPALGEPANGTGISTTVLQKPVSSGKDALDILFDAAVQQKGNSLSSTATTRDTTPPETSPPCRESILSDIPESEVLRIWQGCRFVKGGWFSAKEAVLFIDLLADPIYSLGCTGWPN